MEVDRPPADLALKGRRRATDHERPHPRVGNQEEVGTTTDHRHERFDRRKGGIVSNQDPPQPAANPLVAFAIGVGFVIAGVYLLSRDELTIPATRGRDAARFEGPAVQLLSWALLVGGAGMAAFGLCAFERFRGPAKVVSGVLGLAFLGLLIGALLKARIG